MVYDRFDKSTVIYVNLLFFLKNTGTELIKKSIQDSLTF